VTGEAVAQAAAELAALTALEVLPKRGPAGHDLSMGLQAGKGRGRGNNSGRGAGSPSILSGDPMRAKGRQVRNGRPAVALLFPHSGAIPGVFWAFLRVRLAGRARVNRALANGHLATPKGRVARHPDTVIIATANTYGTGANRQYVGRNQLDAATLDRFAGGMIEADYSQEYEAGFDAEVVKYVQDVRKHIADRQLRRLSSTRMIQACSKLKAAGLPWKDQVTFGWSESEKQGVAA